VNTRATEGREETAEHEILNLVEAAHFLGVSAKTFQKVLREGDVPGRKVGREWKFSRLALTEWIGRGRSKDFLDGSEDPEELGTDLEVARPLQRATTHRELAAEEG